MDSPTSRNIFLIFPDLYILRNLRLRSKEERE
jgi:hypothetical protein